MTSDSTIFQNQLDELKDTVDKLRNENAGLKELAQQADAANKAKSDFLAMISHEIRTPMNGVIGLTELLLGTELEKKQKHYAGLILTSARNLLTLINSLLDFSKIEADMMELDIAEFSLKELVSELMTLYNVSTEQKNVDVFEEFDPRVAEAYLGDSYRIRQILVNLLGNAIKFTEEGSIVLKIAYENMANDTKDMLCFEVRDSGPGIPSSKLDRLFKPFTQVDTSTTRRYGGTGLGLSICQKLVELMGGNIGVESENGKGSTFWFTLPMEPVSDQTGEFQGAFEKKIEEIETVRTEDVSKSEEADDNKPVFMVVDDDETNRYVLETVLQKAGACVVSARNGKEALELYESCKPDVILMDCQMPVMDGFSASKEIHAMSKELSRKRPCIIALTADATQSTKQQCKEVGMDDYLTKPLEFGRLQRVIDNWLPGSDLRVITRPYEPEIDEGVGLIKDDEFQGVKIDTKVLDRLKKNMGDINPVIKVFLGSLPDRLEMLKQAVEALDHEEVRRIAHTLKGSSSQFGAVYMSTLCFQAETMAKNKQMENIQGVFEKINQAASQMVDFLSAELDKK